ncbi:MAG: FGGY family carbohydrate kinase, partial [Armatimonadota bacterium]
MHVMGIDIGTQGARVIVCDANGRITAQASESFVRPSETTLPPGWAEQNPADWWSATETCIRKTIDQLHDSSIRPESIAAISVDSTSGTVVPIDASGTPLRPAMMYNDSRAEAEAS